MGDIINPDPPEPRTIEPVAEAVEEPRELTASEIARQRAARRAQATTRASLKIDPATNSGGGTGLRIN